MKCISVDDYCATIPSPGKGYVDMKLLNEIIARLNKLQSEITRFRSDLTNIIVDILTTAKDNFLCKISTLKGIIDSPLFQRVVGLSVKDIASRLEGENAEKYKILMNLSGIIGKSITDIGKSVAEKSMIGRATFDEMKTFIKGWFNTFNYLDYQLFGYFLYYKLNYCAGKTKSDFMGFINEIIQKQIDSSSHGMIQEIRDIRKKILQSLYKCFYSGEELLQCLDISYAIDSNYEVIKDSVHEFFTLIGKDKKIELSHLDEVIKEFEKAGYKKLWEVWGTEIENKELMAFERKLHKRRLDDLLGKGTNGFLERRIKEFIKNMNTANVDCNDL